jgi:aminopeptidase YwaD
MKTKIQTVIAGLSFVLVSTGAMASAIGQTVASRVDVSSYQNYLDNWLYTHLGMNKGIGGAQHDPCRSNIASILQGFGFTVELHPFTYNSVTYFNVIGTKTGHTFPNHQFIISGHYDTVNNPGADDDASGIAAMLEIARVFSQFDTAYTIKFCAWDREEQGKIGSTAYVNTHPGAQILGMVQLDMIAHDVGTNRENVYGNATALPLKQALMSAASMYGSGITIADAGNATFSDHAPFAAAGYQAVVFVEHLYTQFGCYHNPCDSVDTPNYIHYAFASNLARTVAGWLADSAQASKRGDVTGNGIVDVDDLLALINSWGRCPAPPSACPADIPAAPGGMGDGVVDIDDLLRVINNWG